jgi:hypothetical protein
MASVRVPDKLPARVMEGCSSHHRVDARFHDTPIFRSGVARLQHQLLDAGLRRGAGRGAAHVGYELLVDRALPWDDGLAASVHAAFVAGAGIRGSFEAPQSDRWMSLVDRLVQVDLDPTASTMDELSRRIEMVLARRPRLALSTGDSNRIAVVLGLEADVVAAEAQTLLSGAAGQLEPGAAEAT